MSAIYPWIKALHVIAVISWMAGMLYLPRLFVYHTAAAVGSEMSETFKVMERRLMRGIMLPAAIVTWLCGIAMVSMNPSLLHEGWLLVKIAFVIALTGVHHAMAGWRKGFAEDRNTKSQKFFRIANEVPTLMMIVIVIMVIARPF